VFERYTEKARRTVFFARYEATQLGSEITSEHLLLGLLRDDKAVLRHLLLNVDYESVRHQIAATVQPGDLKLPLNVDLPLAEDAKLVLKFAMEEADLLNMRHIGTEHLLLGMLRDADFPSATVLAKLGADFESLRTKAAEMRQRFAVRENVARYSQRPVIRPSTVEIHGKRFAVEAIQATALLLKQHPFYWGKKTLAGAGRRLRKERKTFLV
jgi:ATP-dependent Clp protease ATP-binding subunit ClpC